MMRFLCAFVLVLSLACPAFAQRAVVPLYDFKAVPVVAPTTAKRVRAAIVNAGLAHWWDVTEAGEGALIASFTREGEYTASIRINYDASQYSVTYLGSTNLRYSSSGNEGQMLSAPRLHEDAEKRQIDMFRTAPATPYAVKTDAYIHPTYEVLVRELLAGIRRQLVAPAL